MSLINWIRSPRLVRFHAQHVNVGSSLQSVAGQNDVDNVIVQTFQTGFQPYLGRTSTTDLAAMKKIVTIVILCSPPSTF
jgi:hypothetical protein